MDPMAPLLSVQSLQVRYGPIEAVRGVDFDIREGEIVAFLGANGAGKSSTLNALVGLVPVAGGKVSFKGEDITDWAPEALAPAGMTLSPEGRRVFGSLSVAENLRMGAYSIKEKDVIEAAWERVYALFPILHERRDQFAGTLSGGQQQRLCIARTIAVEPEIILMDEPASALDPEATFMIEELMHELSQNYTILIVTHNMQQAARVSDQTAFMYMGDLIEYSDTNTLFTTPVKKKTEDYITGRYG